MFLPTIGFHQYETRSCFVVNSLNLIVVRHTLYSNSSWISRASAGSKSRQHSGRCPYLVRWRRGGLPGKHSSAPLRSAPRSADRVPVPPPSSPGNATDRHPSRTPRTPPHVNPPPVARPVRGPDPQPHVRPVSGRRRCSVSASDACIYNGRD